MGDWSMQMTLSTFSDKRIAISELNALGYSEEKGNLVIQEEASEDVTKDYVISTDPKADASLEGVDKVTLVVSTGPKEEPVTVINFVTMTEQEARDAADKLGLTVSVEEVYDDSVEAGHVCWQSIDPNTEVEKGQTIRLRVSKGSDPSAGEPTTQPSTDPNESTPPTDQPTESPSSQLKTISYTVNLPRDRDSVEVVVTVDGQEQYRKTLDTVQQLVTVPLKGSGTQTVSVYFDGQLSLSEPKDFG